MNDTLGSVSTSLFLPARPIPLTQSNLRAIRSLDHTREIFNGLLREAPRPGHAIRSLLRETFQADPDTAGLEFQDETRYSFVSLAQLAIYARSHASSLADLDALAVVRNIPASQGLSAHIPSQLATRLAMLDIPGTVRQQWQRYWDGRAQGTSLSRRHHGREQYVRHFEAAMALALAADELTEAQMRPVTAVLANPEWKMLDGKHLSIETPCNGSGALVFSIEGEDPQVLYLPGRAAAFSSHATRTELESHLPTTAGDISYRSLDDVAHGFSFLLEDLLGATLDTLDHDPGNDPGTHAALALSRVDALEQARRDPQIFFKAPAYPLAEIESVPLSLFDLGSLGCDATIESRSQQIDSQLQLVSGLSDSDAQTLQGLQRSLQAPCEQARQAIAELVASARWHSGAVHVSASLALVAAHHQGLRIHARIQRALGQISAAQLDGVEAMLEQGQAFPTPGSSVLAVYPVIKQAAHVEFGDSAGEEPLRTVVVLTDPATLEGSSDGPLLLYWPGEHGGLLHCANRGELAKCLSVMAEHQSLELHPVSGDVLAEALTQTISQVRAEKQQIQDEQGLDAVSAELPRLREVLEQRLQVPRHAAREAALRLLDQQNEVVRLASASTSQLNALPLATLQALSRLIPDYIAAVRCSETMLAKDLVHVHAFCQERIKQRLKQDFPGYDDSYIGLDLPRSVDLVMDIVSQGGTPGTVTKMVYQPSAEREKMSLEALLLENIDETMQRRLNYLKLDLATDDGALRNTLMAGVNRSYLENLVKQLDLAKAYEEQILAAYQGLDDSPYMADLRRETLVAPYELMLRMQGLLLHGQGVLDEQGLAILQIAIEARSRGEYQAAGHDIRLRAAVLTAGGKDTQDGPDTLSGVTFIEDRSSGTTLLYLPEHSTRPLRQYPDLEAARVSLYELSSQDDEVHYLAGLALVGDPLAHSTRIRQAHQHAFSGIMGVGSEWPPTTSLAEHLLKAQMGRVIQAHRTTTRSNEQLWLENFAHQSQMVFSYLKLVLGMLPFVGTAIGIYDFFDSAARAVNAFGAGKVTEGLEALNDVLLSIIDAAMDVVSGIGVNMATVRQLTRQRQLRQLRSPGSANLRMEDSAHRRAARFAGYQYHDPRLSLDRRTLGTHGRYRGIYRHADGDFIQIEQQPYQVEWDATAHTWRLKGTTRKGWKRAIDLDENGRWDTHFALYGVHLLGGGSGGGQIIGRLADQLDPYWPAAIRDQLPRFLVDQNYRLRQRVTSKAYADEAKLIESINRSNALTHSSASQRELEASYLADVDLAKQSYQSWDDLLKNSLRRNQQVPLRQKARAAKLICERLMNHIDLKVIAGRVRRLEIARLETAVFLVNDFADKLPLLRELRQKAIQHLEDRDAMFKAKHELDIWMQRAERDPKVQAAYQHYQKALNSESKAFFDTLHLMPAALRHNDTSVIAEYFLEQLTDLEDEIRGARNTLLELHEVQANTQQRRQIYEKARTTHEQYKRRLQSIQASFPALFEETYFKRLCANLDLLTTMSDAQLKRLPQRELASKSQPRSSPRLYLDTDGHWHVGEYYPATAKGPAQMVKRSDDGRVIKRFELDGEHWRQQSNAKPPRPNELHDLRQVAQQTVSELPNYRSRIQTYQSQGMLAADVEHMMVIKAEDLERYADRLQQLAPDTPEPAVLRAHARSLRAEGRAMRIEQVKQNPQPNEGHLSYLIEQQQVELRRFGERQMLKVDDYLQEYEVLDISTPDAPVLWYAHFHYRTPQTPFERFSAAHLKRAQDRYHGPQWSQTENQSVWRGPINRGIATQHFAHL